jgi:hypothetical protein
MTLYLSIILYRIWKKLFNQSNILQFKEIAEADPNAVAIIPTFLEYLKR